MEIRDGVHIADSDSVSVSEAAELWITSGESAGLERSTLDQYRRHLKYHIEPFVGGALLSKLTVPAVRAFQDMLRENGRSSAMVRKVLGSLGSILFDAQERGLTVRNPVKDMRGTAARARSARPRSARRASSGSASIFRRAQRCRR